MKPFITKTLLFVATGIAFIFLVCALIYFFVSRGDFYRIDPTKTLLILGHSHPEAALNDTIIRNSMNLAESGESYFYTYVKLKPILHANPNIEAAFIEFTNNVVSEEMTEWIYSNKHVKFRFPKYAAYMGPKEFLTLFSHNFEGTLFATSFSVKNYLSFLASRSSDIIKAQQWGGFKNLSFSKVDSLLAHIDMDTYGKFQGNFPEKNIQYLRKIIDMLRDNGLKVYLIRSPQHPQYPGFRNETLLMNTYRERFADVPFFDFRNLTLEHHDFADLEHLNASGSDKFSKYVNYLIGLGLLEGAIASEQVNDFWDEYLQAQATEGKLSHSVTKH